MNFENNIQQEVINLLENYSDMKRKIALLRYELEHPPTVSADEMISAMNFARGHGTTQSNNTVSNKTLYIAMNYHKLAERLNIESRDNIVNRLVPLENEINRLNHYLKNLDEKHSVVLELYYFEKKTLHEIATILQISKRTTQNLRKEAINKLVEIYMFVNGLN